MSSVLLTRPDKNIAPKTTIKSPKIPAPIAYMVVPEF